MFLSTCNSRIVYCVCSDNRVHSIIDITMVGVVVVVLVLMVVVVVVGGGKVTFWASAHTLNFGSCEFEDESPAND